MKKSIVLTLALATALVAGAQAPNGGKLKTVKINPDKAATVPRPTKPRTDVPKLRVETFYLSNGLKVIACEDHSEPKIYGAVIVHAGSKNEDTAATGVAHYFEHIMFKGTDRIGTTDWEHEAPYLDSISDAYDRLQLAKSDADRHTIQLEINRLNIEASKYAIANETDAILQQMGCTGLNAGTTYDYTVYHNTLPSNQLESWMEVYAERFRNPVYRLFQGELEAVYEERNLYANEMMYTFSRNLFTESFGEHPYSRDIIGHDHHLKNPQPSAMKRFYDRYYVASNMTLLLVGDFTLGELRPMAEKYFSIWPRGERIAEPHYQFPAFDHQIVKRVKQTPIKAGIMVFPGVKANDDDELVLDVMSDIISGGNGSLDRLSTEGRLMGAQLMPFSLQDAGTNVILYIPKLIGQKHEAAEGLIWDALDSVQQGHFSDRLLQSIKMNHIVGRKQALESRTGIASLLQNLECQGSSYDQWLADGDRLQRITRDDIMAIARKYFDRDRCTIVRSSSGFPAKDAAIKPDWDHLEAQNQGQQSPFAQRIAARRVKAIAPQVIDFDRDVQTVSVTPACTLYASNNPRNDLFSLTIAYHYGTADNPAIEPAIEYFNNLGTGSMDLQDYNIELQSLGGTFSLSSGYDYCYINIGGPEENMEAILALATEKLRAPRHDAQQLKNQIEAIEASRKSAKNDASTWTGALYEYVLYGDRSEYINHTTLKELKALDGQTLVGMLDSLFGRDGYITYVGNEKAHSVARIIKETGLLHDQVTVVPQRIRIPDTLSENAVYYCTNKQFLKSDIDILIPSTAFDYKADRGACALFNEYMGGGMNSVFFQEIREFRSLGYSTYGYFRYDRFNRHPAYFYGYLGTQCDKTNDGIAAMHDLMVNFPDRKEKFDPARDYLISVRNSNYIGFRSIPSQVRYWREVEKARVDPRGRVTDQIRALDYTDLQAFHRKYIEGGPFVVFVSGNAKRYRLKDLEQYGPVRQVKYSDMIKF